MKQHFKNAMAAAKFLEADPRVDKVIFPGVYYIIILTLHNSVRWQIMKIHLHLIPLTSFQTHMMLFV